VIVIERILDLKSGTFFSYGRDSSWKL